MTDRIPGAPGRYQGNLSADALEKMQAGEPFSITLTRDDAPIVEGTPYSKAAVLPDELAAKLCPGVADPAPKDAFAALYQIVDRGKSGNWHYRKWSNGVAECWSSVITLEYQGTRCLSRWLTLPFPMWEMVVSMTIPNAENDYFLHVPYVLSHSANGSNGSVKFCVIDDVGSFKTTDYIQVSIHITGLWKVD